MTGMANVEGAPWKILVVDDDEDDFFLIKDLISLAWKECVEVEWLTDPATIVEKICSSQYEASLIDSHSYMEDGLKLIDQIRQLCPDEPILFLSDWPDPAILEEAARRGASSVIHKRSLTHEHLTQEIKRVILSSGR
jgi:CheY-like chemotaxis protein